MLRKSRKNSRKVERSKGRKMPKIKRFEDIKAWQLSRDLVREVYSIGDGDQAFRDFGFKDQIRRSAVSTMSNIAEGFERFSDKEFAQFLNIARGSAGEVRSHLYVALDKKYITQQEFDRLKDLCETTSKHIWKFIEYLKTSK